MGVRLNRINSLVKEYDRKLYAINTNQDMVQIWREGERPDSSFLGDVEGDYISRPNPQFILALTDTWHLSGNPVEWGLEPIAQRIRTMDSWTRSDIISSMHKQRENEESDRKRHQSSDIRARAADCRKDFARATNDLIIQKA